MMRPLCRLSAWAPAAALLALALAGCSAPATPMETVTAELDPAAPVLFRGDPAPFVQKLDRRLDEWSVDLLRHSSEGEEPMRRLSLLAGARLALHLLFDAEDAAFGAASTPLEPAAGAPLYRNDLLLCRTPRDDEGLLWRLFGTADRDLSTDLRAIPADALFAADFTLDAAAAEKAAARLLASLIGPDPAPGRTAALAEAITGPFGLVVLPVEDEEDLGVVAILPDRGGVLYDLLVSTLPANDRGEPELEGHTGYFRHEGGATIFFSSRETEDAFAADTPRLIDDPAMQPYLAGLPAAGTGFLYLSDEPLPFDRLADLPPRTLLILTAENDGLRCRANAAWNWLDLAAAMLLPVEPPEIDDALLDRLKSGRNGLLETLDTAACRARLLRLRDALFDYRARHGVFPAPEGLEGLRLLIGDGLAADALLCPAATADRPAEGGALAADNCSYIFFGAPGENDGDAAPSPLVMDWPKNHAGRFGVLFADGEVRFFALPPPQSARRAVSVLQSRFRYPEPEFRRLLRIADELDRENP